MSLLPVQYAMPVAIGRFRIGGRCERDLAIGFITPKQLVDWRQLVQSRWIERLANMIADERAEPFASLACLGRHGIKRTELGVRAKMRRHVCGHGVSLFQPGDEAAAVPEPLDLLPHSAVTLLRKSSARSSPRSSSICSAITGAVSRSIPNSRNTSAPGGPPLLAVWGKNDPFFLPAGAEAFRRDNPDAEIHLLDAGHFALKSQDEPHGGSSVRCCDHLVPWRRVCCRRLSAVM
jgi:pimeloyl-ACP methyl ester carboxylesterase